LIVTFSPGRYPAARAIRELGRIHLPSLNLNILV
jgi:hypothetical protein